jgi:hypothetical protein
MYALRARYIVLKISKAISRRGHRVISRDISKYFVYRESNYVHVDQN